MEDKIRRWEENPDAELQRAAAAREIPVYFNSDVAGAAVHHWLAVPTVGWPPAAAIAPALCACKPAPLPGLQPLRALRHAARHCPPHPTPTPPPPHPPPHPAPPLQTACPGSLCPRSAA